MQNNGSLWDLGLFHPDASVSNASVPDLANLAKFHFVE